MDTDKPTVFDLFEKQRRYLVPLFQRGYVWQRTNEWEPLWQDIITQTTDVRQNGKPRYPHHFLGAIVLNQVPTMIRQVAASEIIDGQQRLLTLQLLLHALKDIAEEHGSGYSKTTLERLTNNPGPHRDPNEAFKVWPTNAYQEDLHTIKNAGNSETLAKQFPQTLRYKKLTPARPPLIDAYLYFASAINADLNSPENKERKTEALDELTDVITRHLQLVSIELETDDDPQIIFETLNAKGVPLGPADLIRNFLFLYVNKQQENTNTLYDAYWKDFDEKTPGGTTFWQEKERQGRLTRTRFDLFFFHYTTAQTTQEINVSHLFQTFKTWWNNPTATEATESTTTDAATTTPATPATPPALRTTSDELKHIKHASTVYRSLIQPKGDNKLALFARRVKALDTTTIYPLTLWLCEHQTTLSVTEFDGILTDLESYLIRRMICARTTKAYNRIFLNLLTTLKIQGTPTRASVQAELSKLTGETVDWPDDKKVTEALIKTPLYNNLNQARVRLLLEGVERATRTTKQENLPIPESLSIEHVLPQTDETTVWPFPPDGTIQSDAEDDATKAQNARLLREIMKHTIGNLTLVTTPLNSSLQRGPFKDKRPEITKSLLVLNAYFQQFSDDDPWDERNILQRSKLLAAIIIRIWPHHTAETTTA